jgi:hypothetical protein
MLSWQRTLLTVLLCYTLAWPRGQARAKVRTAATGGAQRGAALCLSRLRQLCRRGRHRARCRPTTAGALRLSRQWDATATQTAWCSGWLSEVGVGLRRLTRPALTQR